LFSDLTGNEHVKAALMQLIKGDRLPGSMLFAGEEGVGKKRFALEVARTLNCRSPKDGEACGVCGACTRILKINYPSNSESDDWEQIIWTDHPDVGLVVAPKRVLRVTQMRQIEREANYRPFEGKARVFLVDDADKLNDNSANALLKILEEPPRTSYLILLTARPAMLLPTILSRCQMIRFSPLTPDDIEQYLVKNKLVEASTARLRARTASGSLGRALASDIDKFESQRKAMIAVLNALVLTNDNAQLLRSAEQLNEAQYKDEFEERLDVLETLIRDAWMLALGVKPELLVNEDLLPELTKVSQKIDPSRAQKWVLLIEDMREQLIVNINRKVASDSVFLRLSDPNEKGRRVFIK
jgi:DNA polymerase-3 subunit delta'